MEEEDEVSDDTWLTGGAPRGIDRLSARAPCRSNRLDDPESADAPGGNAIGLGLVGGLRTVAALRLRDRQEVETILEGSMHRKCCALLAAALLLGGTGSLPARAALLPELSGARTEIPEARFEANLGQIRGAARYYARADRGAVYFEPQAVVLEHQTDEDARTGVIVLLDFPGSAGVKLRARGETTASRMHVFRGDDPALWHVDAAPFTEIRYEGIAPGATLVYRVLDARLKYDVEVAAGAELGAVRLRFRGVECLEVDAAGGLRLHTAVGVLREERPFLYQLRHGERVAVPGGYRLIGRNVLGFWASNYDRAMPLVVDPGLLWSTFLGGGGTDYATAVTTDRDGNVVTVGVTTSTDYPTTPGAFQRVQAGDRDVCVTKLASDGTTVIWSTLLGGSAADNGLAVALDAMGNVYVGGITASSDFPTTAGAWHTGYAGGTSDGFVAKLAPDGSALAFSTLLGGSSNDLVLSLGVDLVGSPTVAGYTGSTDFPTTPGVVRPSRAGLFPDAADGFVTKLNSSGSAPIYSTYVGVDGGTDEIFALELDGEGRATVAGMTESPNFPTTAGAFDRTHDGYWEGFVARLNENGSDYVYSTFLGGNGNDEIWGLALDAGGNASVGGRTSSSKLPVTAGAAQQSYGGGAYDGFVARLSADGSALLYCTYLGSSGSDQVYAVTLSAAGEACVTGTSDGADFPVTPGSFQSSAGGGSDAFVTRIAADGGRLEFSSLLGGSGSDLGRALAFRPDGRLVVAGYTSSSDFPTTEAAFDSIQSGAGAFDAFVTVMDVGASQALDVQTRPPPDFRLRPPHPNPFVGRTTFSISLHDRTRVVVRLLDPQGRLVRTLAQGVFDAGPHTWTWEGLDAHGADVGVGVFFFEVSIDETRSSWPIVRVK